MASRLRVALVDPWTVAVILLLGLCQADAEAPQIVAIDLYGLRTVPAERVLDKIGASIGDTLAGVTDSIAVRVGNLPHVMTARAEAFCCVEGGLVLFVGIAEDSAGVVTYRSAPGGSELLPMEIVEAYADMGKAILRWNRERGPGRTYEDYSQGHALSSGPEARAIQLRFVDMADKNRATLEAVLHHAHAVEHRRAAAWVIAYATDKSDVIPALVYAVSDPDVEVRNNATRALGVLAKFEQYREHIAPQIFIRMLSSVQFTDRNKALSVLAPLSESRDPALLDMIRRHALPALSEMARWSILGYAANAHVLLGRIAGVSDEEISKELMSENRLAKVDGLVSLLEGNQ